MSRALCSWFPCDDYRTEHSKSMAHTILQSFSAKHRFLATVLHQETTFLLPAGQQSQSHIGAARSGDVRFYPARSQSAKLARPKPGRFRRIDCAAGAGRSRIYRRTETTLKEWAPGAVAVCERCVRAGGGRFEHKTM